MHRKEILETALKLTTGDRNKSYGDPVANYRDTAAGWSLILGTKVTASQAALCMAWVKMCRLKKTPNHEDSFIDGAAYLAIAGQCAEADVNEGWAEAAKAEAGSPFVMTNVIWPDSAEGDGVVIESPAVTMSR